MQRNGLNCIRDVKEMADKENASAAVGDGSDQSEVVQLDDELEDVFNSAEKDKFTISQLSEQSDDAAPRRSGDTQEDSHRKRSFPHVLSHIRSRTPKRSSSSSTSTTAVPTNSTKNKLEYSGSTIEEQPDQESPQENPAAGSPAASESRASGSVLDDFSDATAKVAATASTDDEEAPSKSDLQQSPVEDGFTAPTDKRVQFDPQKLDVNKKRRKSRHHHSHHHKPRKYSLQEEPQWKREGRRVSIQPEDAVLAEADLEDLDSHRSDDPRGLRRPKIQKPQSGDSFIQISRKVGNDLQNLLTPNALKKIYDHSPHEVFVQLDELVGTGEDREWKETARWVKYEEDLEEGSDRWGRPHVASLSFHSLLNLRRCLQSCAFLLDTNEKDLTGVVYRVTEQMFIDELIAEDDKSNVMRSLLMRHKHVNDNDKSFRISFRKHSSYSSLQSISDMEKGKSRLDSFDASNFAEERSSKLDVNEKTYTSTLQDEIKKEKEESILKRIPAGAEATTVLVGSVDFLSQPTIAFVRLAQGIFMPSITEVTIPVRFMFVLLGPSTADLDYHEVGRSISTLMSNRAFHQIAYKATTRKDLLSAINDFLDDSIVLPPGNWESQAILPFEDLKAKSDMIARRKRNAMIKNKPSIDVGVISEDNKLLLTSDDRAPKPPPFNPLQRTGKPFGGIWNDIKRRFPFYVSDIKDGLNGQCLAATIFMYFAALSSAITFGGLIADKTGNLIGISETLLSTAVTGVVFALLSGQPMMVVGTTGPLLLLDQSLFNFCKSNDLDFLSLRIYIGFWLAIISAIVACLEGSVLVKLFSRFLEDIFSSLISLIFIMEPITKLWTVFQMHPLLGDYCPADVSSMSLRAISGSFEDDNTTENQQFNEENDYNCTSGTSCEEPESLTMQIISNQPNTALFSMFLTLGTFTIAYFLRIFRNGKFLGRSARRALGDFGVPIAIVVMVLLSYFNRGIYTEKLNVPIGLTPSDPSARGWFIPFGGSGDEPFPIWMMFAAIIPAFMVYIIIFMETHIAELIVDKPERKLKKGSGFHLDIVIISFLNALCGVIGAPWVCVATVRSVTHVSALTVMSQTHAPGDKPYIIEVKEQRLSALLVSLFVGASVLMAVLLRMVPLAVLFGIFLYMGISSMNGIQFFERLILFLMPVKHHPPVAYVKRVPTWKMHLFTIIQCACLAILWGIKSSSVSLAFPFFLILMIPLRAQLKRIFTPSQLIALDGKQQDIDAEDEPDFYAEATLPG